MASPADDDNRAPPAAMNSVVGSPGLVAGRPPISVALVSTADVWGGAEEQARLLALGLRERGHRCELLVREASPFAERMSCEGFPVHRVLRHAESKLNLLAWRRMRQVLTRLQPDVLHLNDSASVTCAQVATFGLQVPAVVHLRHTCFPVRHPLLYRRLCDRIVCVTAEGARICADAGIPADQLRVVFAGSDHRRVAAGDRLRGRESLGLADDERLLLTVAAFNECKGHQYLLEALRAVLARSPNVRLALAGDGPLRGELEQLAKQLGVADRVLFLGFRDDVPDLLQAADLCVIPSVLEGICSTLVEAMLAERPVVTTVVGGMAEVVTPSDRARPLAWTVPARSPSGLAAAILEALGSPQECVARSRRAAVHARSRLTADQTIERLEEVYYEALGQGPFTAPSLLPAA